jgi:hypothetical protein
LPDSGGHPRSQAYQTKSKKVAVEEGLWLTFQQGEEIVEDNLIGRQFYAGFR